MFGNVAACRHVLGPHHRAWMGALCGTCLAVRDGSGQLSRLVVSTDAVFTEFFRPDVFVAQQRITGDEAINPDVAMELRVEFTKLGRGTLVRIIQGPYDPDVATEHATGWEAELDRLEAWLEAHATRIETKGARR